MPQDHFTLHSIPDEWDQPLKIGLEVKYAAHYRAWTRTKSARNFCVGRLVSGPRSTL